MIKVPILAKDIVIDSAKKHSDLHGNNVFFVQMFSDLFGRPVLTYKIVTASKIHQISEVFARNTTNNCVFLIADFFLFKWNLAVITCFPYMGFTMTV